jgi:tetratricopeptide (TPR) repeat protein
MVYELVGRSTEQNADAMTITDLVLAGQAFRRSLILSDDDAVSSISGHVSFLTEIKERMGSVYEGAVSPIAMARRILSIVSTSEVGRLFVWDLDAGSDYVLYVDRGCVTFVSTSAFADRLNEHLGKEDLAPMDWQGPTFVSIDVHQRLAAHLGASMDEAQSAMTAVSLDCVVDMFASKNVRISWVDDCPAHKPYFELPISDLVKVGIERTASEADLNRAIEQIDKRLYPAREEQWQPWFPVASVELFETPSEHYRIEELVRLFKSYGSGKMTAKAVNASLLTFLSSGYLIQKDEPKAEAVARTSGTSGRTSAESAKRSLLPKDYYRRLNIASTASILEIRKAFQNSIAKLNAQHETNKIDSPGFEQMKQQYQEAEIILTDRMTRRAYDEAVAARVDFLGQGFASRILGDHFRKEGERRLRDRDYDAAIKSFHRSSEYESSDEIKLLSYWAEFLGGDQTKAQCTDTIEKLRGLEAGEVPQDRIYLYYGKVSRLSGEVTVARDYLNRAVEFDKNNQEAWGELRLLNTKPVKKKVALSFQVDSDSTEVSGIVFYTLLCLMILLGLANYVPDARTDWPLVNNKQIAQQVDQQNEFQSRLAAQLLERITKERELTMSIPADQRVWGNVEYYHLEDDSWFLVRRVLLLAFGLIGIALFLRKNKDWLVPREGSYGYLGIVIPYGLIVGFLSYVPSNSTELSTLLGMGLLTVVAEQVFFFGFLGRAFLTRLDSKAAAVSLTILLFAVYQYTFFANLSVSVSQSAVTVLQTTLFVAGACGWALYRSKTLLTPLVLHVSIQVVLMLKFSGVL